jgi:Putative death-receptor fusion protein (DUF2428)
MQLCLPSRSQWNEFATEMQLCEKLKGSFFPFLVQEYLHICISLVADCHFNLQARVHAFNILQSCLLDSPIANKVFPYVGLAFISAMIGYTDSEWSVRNSSIVVFAAAMLCSIDTDQNSTRTDATGQKGITADELFCSFPLLAPFALAVLNGGFHDISEVQQAMSLQPVLPILLLLSRIQPISQSGDRSMLHVELFVPAVLKYLSHQQIKIWKSAARAIKNMVLENMDSPISNNSIMSGLQQKMSLFTMVSYSPDAGCHWNYLLGLLLTVHELSIMFPEANRCFSGSLLEDMFVLTTEYNGSLRVPYLCAMVAIEIIWHLSQNHDCSHLILTCRGITLHLERMNQLQVYDIGLAELGTKVSLIFTTILSPTLFNSTASYDEKCIAISDLSLLLHANCIDLRCAAVKAFKKILHHFFNKLPDVDDSFDQFGTIAELLHVAIIHEVDSHCFHGPHPQHCSDCQGSLLIGLILTKKQV